MENRPLLLKISINFSAHMDKDRKKNRNRSNLTTAAIQYPDEFWLRHVEGGTDLIACSKVYRLRHLL